MADTAAITQTSEEVLGILNTLVESGEIKRDEVSNLRQKYQNAEDLIDGLKEQGKIPETTLVQTYAIAKKIPYIDLLSVDEKAIGLIDRNVASQFGFIPFALDDKTNTIQIAIAKLDRFKSLNPQAIQALEKKLNNKIELFVTTETSAEKVLSKKNSNPIVRMDLSGIEIEKNALRKIPYDVAKKYRAVIFRESPDEALEVAAVDPKDQGLLDILKYVEKETGVKIRIFETDSSQISQVLEKYREFNENLSSDSGVKTFKISNNISNTSTKASKDSGLASVADQSTYMENPDLVSFLGKSEITLEDIKKFSNTGQMPQLLAAIIFLAIKQRASDIHIEPFEKAIRIRFRVDGELSDIILLPIGMASYLVARVKILSKLKLDEQRVPQDGRFETKVGVENIDIRVSTLPTVFGEKIALRLLSKSRKMEQLEDLGFDGINFDRTIEAISKPYGVVLLTGPTGSGKTTSLYSILYRLNKPDVNIITLEDPVEYEIPGINQTQIKPQIGFGFAEGLRSILRQDPNVIMVGEIRDHDTAELVTHAALTGHLVLSTLHTNDASSSLPRLYDLGVEPFLITSSLNAAIAQRLVRRICPKCRYEVTLPQSVSFAVKKELEKLNINQPVKFFKGKGCQYCKDGFKGRVGIFEVLSMTDKIENLVLSKATSTDIFTEACKEGMITIKQDGLIKAIKGITTVDEVLRVTSPI